MRDIVKFHYEAGQWALGALVEADGKMLTPLTEVEDPGGFGATGACAGGEVEVAVELEGNDK